MSVESDEPLEIKQLKDAKFYKEQMIKERQLRLNLTYITELVEQAVARQDARMTVAVPFASMDDEATLAELRRRHFSINATPLLPECFCGADDGKCEAALGGMPTETCAPTRFEVSWKDAQ